MTCFIPFGCSTIKVHPWILKVPNFALIRSEWPTLSIGCLIRSCWPKQDILWDHSYTLLYGLHYGLNFILWISPVLKRWNYVKLAYRASLWVRPIFPFKILGKLTHLVPCKRLHSICTQIILQATVNSSLTTALFIACVDAKFHGFLWVRGYFMAFVRVWACHTLFFYQIWKKVDIRKVKADQLTILPPCMYALSPQSGPRFGRGSIRMLCWPFQQ